MRPIDGISRARMQTAAGAVGKHVRNQKRTQKRTLLFAPREK